MKRALISILLFFVLVGAICFWLLSTQVEISSEETVRLPAAVEDPKKEEEARDAPKEKVAPREEEARAREALVRDSRAPWVIRRDGSSIALAGGVLPTDSADPLEASQQVLRKYGPLFGASAESSALTGLNREGGNSQVIYQQLLDGEPVFGSRINMFFNERGELVHLVADTYGGPAPARNDDVGPSEAALRLRAALFLFLAKRGPAPAVNSYPLGSLESAAVRGYRLIGESVSLVYRFQFSLVAPHFGDVEAFVDARDGTVAVLREISRK